MTRFNYSFKGVPFLCCIILITSYTKGSYDQTCDKFSSSIHCNGKMSAFARERRYILFNVNPGEGFNLRRDVYMRIASLVKLLRHSDSKIDWILVLPPWGPLYHWKSEILFDIQVKVPWKQFFDLDSLSQYVPVIELDDFIDGAEREVEQVVYLQHYPDTFATGEWVEKADVSQCLQQPSYEKNSYQDKSGRSRFTELFWGYDKLFSRDVQCLSIQGHVSTLHSFIKNLKSKSIMIDKAEVILHDVFGDINYWNVRRSMRFSKHLIAAADKFRKKFLDSTDSDDNTVVPESWKLAKNVKRNAIGGLYIAVHLRRQDYVWARPKAVPDIDHAVKQIKRIIDKTNLSTVYIATDAPNEDFNAIKQQIKGSIRFTPTAKQLYDYLDGGVAIIDQWICAHSRYFIGSFESTFSFRIQEEREILGFKSDSTFNCLCGENKFRCQQPTRWAIVI